jgi:hypothetical protein
VENIKKIYPHTQFFCDDGLVAHEKNTSSQQVTEVCRGLFDKVGLSLNIDKCKSTENGGIIEYMGSKYNS